MQTAQRRLGLVFVMASIAMLLAGCAYTRRQQAERTEQLLSAAGFKMKTADTTAKFARIKAMPQLTLRPLQRQGKTYWVYPDVEGCHCAYLGNQTAYQRYQNLAVQMRIAKEEKESAEVNEDAAIIDQDAVWESWGFDVW